MPPTESQQSTAPFHNAIQRIWYPEDGGKTLSPAARLLVPPAFVYRSLTRFRNRLYDRGILPIHSLPCPVISVGNITVGGTGKTPAVIMIADILARHGFKPAILSRGYGGASRSPVNIVSNGKALLMQPADAGDEPVLMARKLPNTPVLTGPRRSLTGEMAIERFGANVLILDDAFQHRQLHRDINIVLADGQNPFGNGLTLPAGPLREHPNGILRADIVILTGTKKEEESGTLERLKAIVKGNIPIFEGRHKPLDLIRGLSGEAIPLDRLKDRRIFAFAGIASPGAFRRTIEASEGKIVSFLAFDDHHRYTDKDICDMANAVATEGADLAVTTEKDGVKLAAYPDFMQHLFVLRISMELSGGQDDFTALILSGIESWKKQKQQQ